MKKLSEEILTWKYSDKTISILDIIVVTSTFILYEYLSIKYFPNIWVHHLGCLIPLIWLLYSKKLNLKEAGWFYGRPLDYFWPAFKMSFICGMVTVIFYVYFGQRIFNASTVVIPPFLSNLLDDPLRLVELFIFIVFIGPLAEEIFFRGFLYRGIRGYIGTWPAIILTSFLFGVIHMNYAWPGQLMAGLLGLILCINYHRYGSMWVNCIMHCIVNGVAFTMIIIVLLSKTM